MSEIECSRCGARKEGLARPPLPGELGERLRAHVCRECWAEWLGTQVKYINEYQLNPANPEHYEFLVREMTSYCKLPGPA